MATPRKVVDVPPVETWPEHWAASAAGRAAGAAVLDAFRPFLDQLAAKRTPATVATHLPHLYLLGAELVAFLAADPRNTAKGPAWFFQNRMADGNGPVPAGLKRKPEINAYLATCRALIRFVRQQRLAVS